MKTGRLLRFTGIGDYGGPRVYFINGKRVAFRVYEKYVRREIRLYLKEQKTGKVPK